MTISAIISYTLALFFAAAIYETPLPTDSILVLFVMGGILNFIHYVVARLATFVVSDDNFIRFGIIVIIVPYVTHLIGQTALLPDFQTVQYMIIFTVGIIINVVIDLLGSMR